ncbi:MAG: transcriptional regulator [Candidatus Aegiribacteria sp.]|nr:transcriptional regulator [Candidatus Aegiribacteria sp.]
MTEIPKKGRNTPIKGSIDLPTLGLAESLFSRVQLRVLALLFGQPERSFQGAELIRLAASGVGAVRREIRRLVSSGLVIEVPLGRRKLYRVNQSSPIFQELHDLILKTVGLTIPVRDALLPFTKSIRTAFIYGSIAMGDDSAWSDVDLLIVGEDLAYPDVISALQPVEQRINRKISVQMITFAEWREKSSSGNPFILNVLSKPRLFLIGSDNDLE